MYIGAGQVGAGRSSSFVRLLLPSFFFFYIGPWSVNGYYPLPCMYARLSLVAGFVLLVWGLVGFCSFVQGGWVGPTQLMLPAAWVLCDGSGGQCSATA